MIHRRLLVAAAVLSAAGGTAQAGFVPAWSHVPAKVRAHLAAESGGVLFLPARAPSFYRYRTGARVVQGTLTVPFTNRVRLRAGIWRWTTKTFVWSARRYSGDCTAFASADKTMQLSGNRVYWSDQDQVAWRCVKDGRGRTYVLSATSSSALASAGLASVVASGLDVSERTSAVTTALAVRPRTVRRGATVLVSGVAGGCTAGDRVTVISRAFSAAHTFAGVPAAYAQVGSAGRFSVVARIPAARRPGSYVLTARCGGGNLGVSAHLTVRA